MSTPQYNVKVEEQAKALGFSAVGIIPIPILDSELSHLERAISLSYHGEMSYLERNHHLRREPKLLLPEAESIIVTLTSYKPSSTLKSGEIGIASYAFGGDYHPVIKERLNKLAQFIGEERYSYRVFTDSAPIFERALALRAGLGFIGKSGMLINPIHGVYTLIGVILTERPLHYPNYGESDKSLCGECRRCIDACPNGALVEPYVMDARRCISYRTIEWQGRENLGSESIGSRDEEGRFDYRDLFFGCDICINVCPWSRAGEEGEIEQFAPLKLSDGRSITELRREEWLEMEESYFNRELKRSPLKRAGLDKIKSSIRASFQ